MKHFIYSIVILGMFTFPSCSKSPCSGCQDLNSQIEVTNSTSSDWNYRGPNAVNTYEKFISVYLGGDLNGTPSSLTPIASYRVTISKGDNIIQDQTELNLITGDIQSGYKLRIPVSEVAENTSKGSEMLDFVISVTTDSQQTFNLDGKIQYIDCDLIDFDEFDANDCRWSCQLGPVSLLGNGCVYCF